jgi:hypothetical protein
MIATISHLFAEIRRVLGDQVLSQMKPATWMASDIRTCLTLLTYLEDAVAGGEAMLVASNKAMNDYVATLLARDDIPWLDDGLRTVLTELPVPDGGQPHPHMTAVERGNLALLAALSAVIRKSSEHGRGGGLGERFAMEGLRQCLTVIRDGEFAIAERASRMQPF